MCIFSFFFGEKETAHAKASERTRRRQNRSRNYPRRGETGEQTAADSMINKFIVLFRHAAHGLGRSDTRRDIVTRYCAARLIRGNKFFIQPARLSDTNEFDIQLNTR